MVAETELRPTNSIRAISHMGQCCKQTPDMVIAQQYLQFEMDQPLTLLVFVDASMKAYSLSTYVCQGTQSLFVKAKAQVAPLKQHTLPKLELMAAVIGA